MKRKQARAILQTAARMASEDPTPDLYVQRGGGEARLVSMMEAETDGERYMVLVAVMMRRCER